MPTEELTEAEIMAVRSTWSALSPHADTFSEIFYTKLFMDRPELRSMFPVDMDKQRKLLMATVGVAVGSLDKLDRVLPAIIALGERHAGYGVTEEHYAFVAEALLWTLGKGLGVAFDDFTRTAWTKTYVTLATVMLSATVPETPS